MSNFYQQKSKFENIKSALLTEIGRGVIRLAPAILVLYVATRYFGVSFFGDGSANTWLNWTLAIAFTSWIAFKRIIIFTFVTVSLYIYGSTFFINLNRLNEMRLTEFPLISNVLVASTGTIAFMSVFFMLRLMANGAKESAAKEAAVETAKTPAQRLAESKVREDEYQERQEKEAQEWDEEQHRMNEEMNQRWFDDHHKK